MQIKGQNNTKKFEPAIFGFERTIQQLQDRLHFVYNGYDQSPDSQGGMILRNGYSMVIDEIKSIRRKLNPNYRRNVDQISERWINEETTVNFYKILHKSIIKPTIKNGRRIILDKQISFDNRLTDQLSPKKQRSDANTIQMKLREQIDETCFTKYKNYFNEQIQKNEDIPGIITENITGLIRFDEIKGELDKQGYCC